MADLRAGPRVGFTRDRKGRPALRTGQLASSLRSGDIDFVAETFDRVPESLADDFMFRHIHPFDPPGKTILQAVDVEIAVRIDVFRAYGSILNRSSDLILPTVIVRLISLYSKDATMVCPRCVNTGRFRLADPSALRTVLGY